MNNNHPAIDDHPRLLLEVHQLTERNAAMAKELEASRRLIRFCYTWVRARRVDDDARFTILFRDWIAAGAPDLAADACSAPSDRGDHGQ